MKKIFLSIVSLLFIIPAVFAADNVTFKAEAPQAVVRGQNFKLQYILNDKGRDLRAPEFTGFEVAFGPAETFSFSAELNSGGGSSSQYTVVYTYTLTPLQEGTFNIAPASVKVGNKQYTSNPLVIKVLPPDKAATVPGGETTGSASATVGREGKSFLVLQLSKRQVYEQEPIQATLKLYFREAVSSITSADFPTFEGFVVQDIDDAKPNTSPVAENYNGVNYQTIVLKKWILFPQRSGKIEIPNSKVGIAVEVPKPSNQLRSLFDSGYQTVNKEVVAGKTSVDVLPLPSGRPVSYMNAVGNFSVSSSISSTHVKANEAVTLTLEIKGVGNLKYVKTPEIKFPEDFETYDPKVNVRSVATNIGQQGEKTVEYTIIPRFGGKFTIPGVAFSYFDPSAKEYKTITTESYDLTVDKGSEPQGSGNVSNFTNKESVKLLGQDIRYINVNPMRVSKEPLLIYGSVGYLLVYIIPALLFAIFIIVYRKQARENANIALMKTKKANKVAARRLKLAGKYLKEHDKERFYDEVMKATWGYLSDKLSIPVSELTKDNVETELAKYGVKAEAISAFMDILSTCEFARFAPAQSDTAMDDLYAATVKAIGDMENMVRK